MRTVNVSKEKKTFCLSLLGGKTFPPPILALTNAGVCADSTHIPGETDGGSQDTGRTERNCSNSTNLQRSSSESREWGGGQVPERDPTARMLLSCINKQQQLLWCLRLHHNPFTSPLRTTCPVKFSLTTTNKPQSFCVS